MNAKRGMGAGFTLVEIMIVVAVIGIVLAIAIPGWIKARARAREETCSENLTQVDGAKEQLAFQNNLGPGSPVNPSDIYGVTNFIRKTPSCPAEGIYTINPVGVDPTCSLSSDGHFIKS